METVTYDPDIFKQHAEYLYDQANVRQKGYKLVFGAVGVVVFSAGFTAVIVAVDSDFGFMVRILWLSCLVAGGWLGARLGRIIGKMRTFHLKLEAQNYLCQWKIEQNTRPTGDGDG